MEDVKNHPSIDGWHEAIASSSLVMTGGSQENPEDFLGQKMLCIFLA